MVLGKMSALYCKTRAMKKRRMTIFNLIRGLPNSKHPALFVVKNNITSVWQDHLSLRTPNPIIILKTKNHYRSKTPLFLHLKPDMNSNQKKKSINGWPQTSKKLTTPQSKRSVNNLKISLMNRSKYKKSFPNLSTPFSVASLTTLLSVSTALLTDSFCVSVAFMLKKHTKTIRFCHWGKVKNK